MPNKKNTKTKGRKKVVLVFGNEMLEYDNLAPKVADEFERAGGLSGVEFIKCSSMNDVLEYYEKEGIELYILDVVQGLDKVIMFDDIDRLEVGRLVSLHDFDLGYFLKLMKKMGKIDKIRIIGIPIEGDVAAIKEEVARLILAQ